MQSNSICSLPLNRLPGDHRALVPLLAARVGVPALVCRVSVLPVRTQLVPKGELFAVLPKTRWPRVRAVSNATMVLVARGSVLKSAVLSAPLATRPLSQLADTLQMPEASPLTRLVQVPFWAPSLNGTIRTARINAPKTDFGL